MSEGGDSVVGFAQDRVCTLLGNAGNFWGAYRELVGDNIEDYSAEGQAIAGAFGQAFRSLCNREPPPPSREGGNCPIGYGVRVTETLQRFDRFPVAPTTVESDCNFAPFLYGPIGGVSFYTGQNGFFGYQVSGFDSQGNPSTQPVSSLVNPSIYSGIDLSVAFFPCNPAEESCAPVPIPPTEVNFPITLPGGDITYVDNSNTNITIPVGVTVEAPSINVRGYINMPIRLNFGGNTLNISPQVNLNFTNEGGGRIVPAPTTPPAGRQRRPIERITRDRNGDPIPPSENPFPDFPPSSERGVIIGVMVVSSPTGSESTTVLSQDNNPNIQVPCTGFVNFTYGVSGGIGWSEDFRVKNTRQFIPSPLPTRTIGAEGTPQPGWEMKIYPVIQDIEAFFGYDLTNA